VDDNELILALHDLLERVEKERGINAAAAHDLLAEMAELAAEERGAFLEEETRRSASAAGIREGAGRHTAR